MSNEERDLTPETPETSQPQEAAPESSSEETPSLETTESVPPAAETAEETEPAAEPAAVEVPVPAASAPEPESPGPARPGIPSADATDTSDEDAAMMEDAFAQLMSDGGSQENVMEQLLEDYSQPEGAREGEIIHGRVLEIRDQEVIVDVGMKAEGVVPIDQVRDAAGNVRVKVGDELDVVMVSRADFAAGDYIPLSHERVGRMQAWDNLEKAQKDGLPVLGRVVSRTKGGLTVDVGLKAFMPASHIDVRPVQNLDQFVGQDIPVKILKMNRRRSNVVVSRRAIVEQEVESRKEQTLGALAEGVLVNGVVKSLTEYGAFVDLGGIDGLLHVSDISYGRIGKPSDVLKVGQEITVKVLKFDPSHERVSLGLKQMAPDPWETVPERYPIDYRVVGTVVSVTDYGAFIELEPGVEGLVHISEMTWSRRMKHPSKVVKVGEQIETVVLAVDTQQRRISLGIKQLEPDPWTTIDSRYSVGSVVEGRVRKLSDFGAFLEIEEGIDGLVHISDLSWTKRVKHPSEVVKKGQVVQAVILNIDSHNRRLSLGVKQLQPDAWETFFSTHKVGDVVEGTVVREANFGYFVELLPNVEGLCHNSEIPESYPQTEAVPVVSVGMSRKFRIIKLHQEERRIGLSIRSLDGDEDVQAEVEDAHEAPPAPEGATATIGEALRSRVRTEE